jgi:hypothetical protein
MNVALLSQPQRELRAYLQRVAGDGGIVETPGEASTFVRRLRSAGVLGSTVIAGVAGGVKAGTLYSIIGPDLDVTRGTVKNRVNRAGVLSEVASGVPATDFAGGVLRGTTVEPSATNLLQRSEEFDNSVWVKAGTIPATVTPNTGIAPDGTMTMDTINVPDGQSHIYQNMNTSTAGVEYTVSFWYLGTAGETVRLRHVSNTVVHVKTVTFTGELQRETLTFITGTSFNFVFPADRRAGGNATSFQCWGAQLETGSVATSYIKTEGSAQTRNADVITDDLTLPQTSGIFTATLNNRLITGTRTIATLRGASTTWPVELRNNRFGFRDVVQGADTTAGTHRVSVWWADSGATYRLYVDGTLIGTEQTGATPISGTIGTFDYGMNNSTNWLNDALSEIAVISGGTPTQAQTLSVLS